MDYLKISGFEMVYTDSCFYFDSQIAKDLVAFYRDHKPLTCEIDAYGDFLTALGSRSTDDHAKNVDNVVTVSPDLVKMKKKVFQLLHRNKINLIILNRSRFYHVGTLNELIQNFCIERDLIENLGMGRFVSSKIVGEGPVKQISGVVMLSIINNECIIPYNSVVSYCRFSVPVITGEHNIVSNCSVGMESSKGINEPVILPDDVMFHTIPVLIKDTERFVTVAFGIEDNVKKAFPFSETDKLEYFGMSMRKVLEVLEIKKESVFPFHECNLWKAKLFATKPTMEESFSYTLQQVQSIKNGQPFIPLQIHPLYSMADILHYKDTASLVTYRVDLKQEIS